jgi:anti-sigma factor RsiW
MVRDDTQLLEEFLDGELPANERSIVEGRLHTEPRLVERLAQLKQQRQLRQQAMAGVFADTAGLDKLIASVREQNAIEAAPMPIELKPRPHQGRRWWQPTSSQYAAAAALLIGTMGGIYYENSRQRSSLESVAAAENVIIGEVASASPELSVGAWAGDPTPSLRSVYRVQLRDPSGQVVMEYRFGRPDYAQNMVEDLNTAIRNDAKASGYTVKVIEEPL